jgi:uncharacterized protein (TIGR03083 family)
MTALRPDHEVRAAYRDLRGRLIDLLADIPESSADLRVPACPNWTVRLLLGHLVGVPEDIMAGNMGGVTTPAWTQAQADRHAADSIADLRRTLVAQIATFDPVLEVIPAPVSSQFVMDAVTHEHDLREALGLDGQQDSTAVHVALAWLMAREPLADGLADRLSATPTSPFVLMRALSGRMSVARMDQLGLPGADIAAALAGTPLVPPADLPG